MTEPTRSRIAFSLLSAGIFLAQLGPLARAASAEPGPRLTTPSVKLAAALNCYGPIARGGRPPVLLLPAAQNTPKSNWEGGYTEALALTGRVACTMPLVLNGAGDIQDSVEYVVYAVRNLARRSGQRIAIVGPSQGGIAAAWALEHWPDLASHVTDVVTFGAAFQGVQISRTTCDVRGVCEPGTWQVATGSHFVSALNRGDPTPKATAYTTIYSDTDEFARLPRAATHLAGAHEVGIQEVCPGRPVEHLQQSEDAVVFALVRDALDHAGPASAARISRTVCASVTPPGFDASKRAAAIAGRGSSEDPTTDHEPPLRCYADPACGGHAKP